MLLHPLTWLARNVGTLVLAAILSLVVWISAVTAADPNVEFVRIVALEVIGKDSDLLIVGELPEQVRVTLSAPRSIRDRMGTTDNAVRAWIDVTGLQEGEHQLEVQTQTSQAFTPVRETQVVPEIITVVLEPLVTRSLPVQLEISGEPAPGYQTGDPARTPTNVTISGPASLVRQVSEVHAAIDISDASETIRQDVPVVAFSEDGAVIAGVNITPHEVEVTQPISLLGGYRNVVVRVVTTGQQPNGYRLTNITVSPPNVVLFSNDPQLVIDLPSFVETEPLDLTGAEDDIDVSLALNLPPGISVVGSDRVLVQVGIAVMEGSLTVTVPVQAVNFKSGLAAEISPNTVELILSGPVPVLNRLQPADIRVVVDVEGLDLGVYQLTPVVRSLPSRVSVETILPASVEVVLIVAPTATPSPTPGPNPTTGP